MRRRPPVGDRHELMDAKRWPQCLRFDGGMQPCVCWFAQAQGDWIGAGNEWPGNDLTDLMDLLGVHECSEPFDPGQI